MYNLSFETRKKNRLGMLDEFLSKKPAKLTEADYQYYSDQTGKEIFELKELINLKKCAKLTPEQLTPGRLYKDLPYINGRYIRYRKSEYCNQRGETVYIFNIVWIDRRGKYIDEYPWEITRTRKSIYEHVRK